MRATATVLATLGLMAAAPPDGPPAFPTASPESQGVSAEALNELANTVRGYVDDEIIVGGELLVIKNRRIVLHEVFGQRDRDDAITWEKNTLCNIRTMSMGFIGAAAQILIDEERLDVNDRVAKHLPSFNNDLSRLITVRHLLTHRSGLPYRMQTKRFSQRESMREIANLAGVRGPDFKPGSEFRYSDADSEVLGAVVEVVTGVPLQAFVAARIIEPLGMTDTFTLADPDDPRARRIASLYAGARSNWTRIWSPDDAAPYPSPAGSQNVHGTAIDYAKFLAMWMDDGWVGQTRVLSRDAIDRTLTPQCTVDLPTGFADLETHYGQMAVLYMQTGSSDTAEPIVIGHAGSDGTWAAAWPDLDLMVLYFTQSRGQASGIRLEGTIDELLINPGKAPVTVEIPEQYKPYVGVYVANFAHFVNEPFTVSVQDGHLAVDIPSQLVFKLKDPDDAGLWQFTFTKDIAASFERGVDGVVNLMKIHQANHAFMLPRQGSELAAMMADSGRITAAEARRFVGRYYHPERQTEIEILHADGRLYIKVPEGRYDLLDPDEKGRRPMRANPTILTSFRTDERGRVISLIRTIDGEDLVMPRVDVTGDDDPE